MRIFKKGIETTHQTEILGFSTPTVFSRKSEVHLYPSGAIDRGKNYDKNELSAEMK